jgi:hypothetical protein
MNIVPLEVISKKCFSCKSEKPISDFWKGQCYCKPCSSEKQKKSWSSRTPKKRLEQHLLYKYNLKMVDLVAALEEQSGNCSICSSVLPDLLVYENRRRGYAIDHNHETGSFRGILCLNCNSMLGMAKDDPKILDKAAKYLREKGSYTELHKSRTRKK